MKATKLTRQLPARGGLNDLDRSQRTIIDYAKASPIKPDKKTATILTKRYA